MRTLVPFDVRDPNSRLSPVLSPSERRDFARVMLRDVLDAVHGAGGDPHVLATSPLPDALASDLEAPVIVDERPLSTAVGAHLEVDSSDNTNPEMDDRSTGTAVVMSDLAIATPTALRRAFVTPDPGEVAAAPGLAGGTNVLVVVHPGFEPDYHGTSFRDHQRAAAAVGAPFRPIDSFRLAVDVDGPDDLPEVLLHGRGRTVDWLTDAGFSVAVTDGRATLERSDDS